MLVTHDLEEAQALADRICVLNAGTTLQTGAPDEVACIPKACSSRASWVSTISFRRSSRMPAISVAAGKSLSVADLNGFRPGESVIALLPPDAISLADAGAGDSNLVKGTVAGMQRMGELAALTLEVPEGSLRFRVAAREAGASALRLGDAVGVRLDPSAIHVMHEG